MEKKCFYYLVTSCKSYFFLCSGLIFSNPVKNLGKNCRQIKFTESSVNKYQNFWKVKVLFHPGSRLNLREFLFLLGQRYGSLQTYEYVLFRVHIFFIFHYQDKNPDFKEKSILIVYLDIHYPDEKCWEKTCLDWRSLIVKN